MTSAQLALFGAVFTQTAMTFVIYLLLVRARFAYATKPENMKPELAYDQAAWPVKARQIANSVQSQFELPVLFYAAVLFAFEFGAAGWIAAAIAWVFVATRIVHAILHIGKNIVMRRFQAFVTGFATLIVFWLYLAFHVFSAGTI